MEKKNNGFLIGIIIILVIALIGAGIFIAYDKGIIFDNDTKTHENDEGTKETQKNTEEKEITNILQKENLEKFVSFLNIYSLNTVSQPINGMYTNLTLSDTEKLQLALHSLDNKNEFADITIAKNQIKINDNNNSVIDAISSYGRQIGVEEVENEYRLLFNENIITHTDILTSCPSFYYDSVNSMYYTIHACGGTSGGSGPISYINKYTEKGNEAYIYINIGYLERQGDNYDTMFNIYTDLNKTVLYKTMVIDNMDAKNAIINETNYMDFSEYKFTFEKRQDGSFYYKSIEKIR